MYLMGAGSKRFPGNDTPAYTTLQTWLELPHWPEFSPRSKAQKYRQTEKWHFLPQLSPRNGPWAEEGCWCWRWLWEGWIQEPPQPPHEAPRVSHLSVHTLLSRELLPGRFSSGHCYLGEQRFVLSLAICHFSSRLRNGSDLEIALLFFLHPSRSKITHLCFNTSLLGIFRGEQE